MSVNSSGSGTTVDATISAVPAGGGLRSAAGDPSPRFPPGAMIGERYRVAGLLGRGGMGEVYRADDLTLGQSVALKFLPAELAADPVRRRRFLEEVRTALRVTHPNVCRVYDIGEFGGQHYLSMEYVDGEDLASLLRRIGRLPQERAVEVARQICAGLAAAHAQGILHRDLKPANIMVDGRGQVRLTDFGLAALAESIDPAEVRAGTPAYQAPEQLQGQAVTRSSDLYALGLVLYELFTGRRAFAAQSLRELQDLHASAAPDRPSSHVAELDPAVERAILRCLEKDPAERPPSALAVAAALPGGDPLAAALAAGETPSPELVAQAGERSGLAVGRALALALVAAGLVIGVTRWAGTLSLSHVLPMEKRPEVKVDRARTIIGALGFTEPVYSDPVDHAWGFFTWSEILAEVANHDASSSRWEELRNRPDAASFWYRQSPRLLLPSNLEGPIHLRGSVGAMNPHPIHPGEVLVLLDLAGQLRRFEVMPRRFSTLEGDAAEPDWAPMFALAGLDPARFREDRPRYQRFLAPDHRRAWLGTRAELPGTLLRVEAGSFEGRPVLFNVTTAASLESLGAEPIPVRTTLPGFLREAGQPILFLSMALFAGVHVHRNLARKRADLRGAMRIAWLIFGLFLLGKGLQSHALFSPAWASELWVLIVGAVFLGLTAWASYLAAEPLGRQVWPTMFVSSSRLLSRPGVQWRDPLLGVSVLVGVVAGALSFTVTGPVRHLVVSALGQEAEWPLWLNPTLLRGQRAALAYFLDQSMTVAIAVLLVVVLVVARYLVHSRGLAFLVTLMVWTAAGGAATWAGALTGLVVAAVGLAVLVRAGVVAYVLSLVVNTWCWGARAADWSAWHSEGPLIGLVLVLLLVAYGFWAATGHREPRSA